MAASTRKTWLTVALVTGGLIVVIAVAFAGTAVVLFSRYVKTDYVAQETALQQFERERTRFAGQPALIEYRGLRTPVVRRNPSAPRRELHMLHALAYSASDGELNRAGVPVSVLRVMTVAGRVSFMNLGLFGDERDRITLEDLERHGPGLVVDTSGAEVGPVAVGDALLGTDTRASRLLIWTE